MPIDELPPGEWTQLLIGDHWPSSGSLEVLANNSVLRMNTSLDFEQYADLLHTISERNLASQEGRTAEDTRTAFQQGVGISRSIAADNRIKSGSFGQVHQGLVEFRNSLRELAAQGNSAIDAINESDVPLPVKISEITEVILAIRSSVSAKASSQAGDIYGAIQRILDAKGLEESGRIFALNNGFIPSLEPSKSIDDVRNAVGQQLAWQGNTGTERGPGANTILADLATPRPSPSADNAAPPSVALGNQGQSVNEPPAALGPAGSDTTRRLSPPADNTSPPLSHRFAITETASIASAEGPTARPSAPPSKNSVSLDLPSTQTSPISLTGPPTEKAPPLSTPATASPSGATSSAVTRPMSEVSGVNTATPATTPALPSDHLAENFNTGNQTGAPVSAGAEAIATAAASPVHSTPPPLSTHLPDAGAPSPHVFETAHGTATPAPAMTQIATLPMETTQPMIATPTPTIAPSIAPVPVNAGPTMTPAPTPPSALMAYGADLRPPIANTAVVNPLPPSTSPVSAPMNAPTGSAPTGQPAVVRQQQVTPTAPVAGLTERAVAATAAGAAAGAVAADSAAQNRLRRLLDAVVRQQPQLAWAIGDLEEGTTVLVTDIAGGWIPPGIDIPNGITLLDPADRRGALTALLGPTTRMATHLPGQYCHPRTSAEHVAMSIRPRDVAAVNDLGWELAQATRWRDGLPRLAHTLAKAVTAQTGWLESEAGLLRDHLVTVAQTVIAKYPASVGSTQVADWQLLATIDALINGEKTLAHYHFAWFQAQTLSREAQR